jgi:hypothetical protein
VLSIRSAFARETEAQFEDAGIEISPATRMIDGERQIHSDKVPDPR